MTDVSLNECRKAFELEMASIFGYLTLKRENYKDGCYINKTVRDAWLLWQAAVAALGEGMPPNVTKASGASCDDASSREALAPASPAISMRPDDHGYADYAAPSEISSLREKCEHEWKNAAETAIKLGRVLTADEELDIILGVVQPYLRTTEPVSVEDAAAALYGAEMHGSWCWEYQSNNDLKNSFRKRVRHMFDCIGVPYVD